MNILFLHRSFPGQFGPLAEALQAHPGHRVVAIADARDRRDTAIATRTYQFSDAAAGVTPRLMRSLAASVARGEKAAGAMLALRAEGFVPDVVVGHLGWGETLFVRDVWPATRLIVLAEYYYTERGADVGFDPEHDLPAGPERSFYLRMLNAPIDLALAEADQAVTATAWQASRFPANRRNTLTVLHEGIETDRLAPDPKARFRHATTGLTLSRADEVVTFVSRDLEPYRGYHTFMRALPALLAARPRAQAVIVGGAGVSYGHAPSGHSGWKDVILDEVRDRLPLDRVHFTGRLPYAEYRALLQVSAAHVYLTYPFILSWSLLEAMSVGAAVIGSRTAPVEEVITDGVNGLLVDFFDAAALARTAAALLDDPVRAAGLGANARAAIIARYDRRRVCLPGWMALVT